MPVPATRRQRLAARLGVNTLGALRTAVSSDLRSSPWRRKLALAGVVLWLIYEWGPGNETVTPWILAGIIEDNSGVGVIPLTAAVGFIFTLLQQLASGFTALAGFSMFDRTAHAAWNKLRGGSDVVHGEWSRLGWLTRGSLVFGLGTTAVALIEVMTTGLTGVRRHSKVVVQSATLCAVMVAAIGAFAATLAYVGRRVEGLRRPTEVIVGVLESPLFWLGLLVVLAAVHAIRRAPQVAVVEQPTDGTASRAVQG